jgi:sulfiredoxin
MSTERTMESTKIPLAEIYVPTKRRSTLEPGKVDALAESIIEEGLKLPISVRKGNGRYVLIEGLHRLEACRALGEDVIDCIIVRARQH